MYVHMLEELYTQLNQISCSNKLCKRMNLRLTHTSG
jgi:hypothetical protein